MKTWLNLAEHLCQRPFLTPNNPVIMNLKSGKLKPDTGKEVLKQYYYLVVMIVEFLTIAMVRTPFDEVYKELRRNLGEELGSRTEGLPHQWIFEHLVRLEMRIDIRAPWSKTTSNFINKLLLRFHTDSPIFVVGMIYALESTACPELVRVAEIINLVAAEPIVDITKLHDSAYVAKLDEPDRRGNLTNFLAMHVVDFEVGHQKGLQKALKPHVREDWDEFFHGFVYILDEMAVWWEGLSRGE